MSIKKAKKLLFETGYKLVVYKDNDILYISDERGIKPIFMLYKKYNKKATKAYIADRVIGTAAARILVKLQIGGVFTEVITEEALSLFKKNKIEVIFEKKVEHILNRKKDGLCPMEKLSQRYRDTNILIDEVELFLKEKNLIE